MHDYVIVGAGSAGCVLGFEEYDGHAITMGPALVAPRSRGWLRLRSANLIAGKPPLGGAAADTQAATS
jgi:hypothetical protein